MLAKYLSAAALFTFFILVSSLSLAQSAPEQDQDQSQNQSEAPRRTQDKSRSQNEAPRRTRKSPRLATRAEGMAIAQTALQHWPNFRDKPDCSHLVHEVYTDAGLDYEYAITDDIFEGIERFQRVWHAQPGDLIVWKGHVGIVIDPEEHSFYSSVISGFSVASYISEYWQSRGPYRFYRYRINAAQSALLLGGSTSVR